MDAIEQAGRTYLLAQGFDNYEISAWVGQDSPCAHNLNYWQFGDYLAIGAGAHGKVTVIDVVHDDVVSAWEAGIWRFSRSRNPKDYMANPTKFVGLARIDTDTLAFEYMMNALRLRAGTSLENFVQTTALAWTDIKTVVDAFGEDDEGGSRKNRTCRANPLPY